MSRSSCIPGVSSTVRAMGNQHRFSFMLAALATVSGLYTTDPLRSEALIEAYGFKAIRVVSSCCPLGDIVRDQLPEHVELFGMHCHLRLEYLRPQLQGFVASLLRAAVHDGEVGETRVGRDERRRRDGAILLHVSD
jgi:hypothetical protein